MFSRREFLNKSLSIYAACISFFNNKLCAKSNILPAVSHGAAKSRVVCANNSSLVTDNTISSSIINQLLDTAVENLFNNHPDLVWKQLFSPRDIVGIKVNCLAGRGLSTHIELVDAICEKLKLVGIPDKHIIIWDRHDNDLERAGYSLYQGNRKIQCYGSNRTGFTRNLHEFGSVASLVSRILTDQCTAMINVPVLKDHGIVGVSAAMKNNFGVINNPNKYHDNVGDPFVADVNMLSAIKDKTRLIICDAIAPQYEGGPPYMPQWTWKMNSILLSVDPVALDQVVWEIIEEKRKEAGFPSLQEVGREPVYIATAADNMHRLGTNVKEKIELVKV